MRAMSLPSTRFAESDALHERALAFVRAFESGEGAPEPFEALACDLARFQASHVEGYARLCRARGVDPGSLRDAHEAPAVPTDAFKLARVAAFTPNDARATFRTSGTTIGALGPHGGLAWQSRGPRPRRFSTGGARLVAQSHDRALRGEAGLDERGRRALRAGRRSRPRLTGRARGARDRQGGERPL